MSRAELERILDFILNKADESEFEVIKKACERRTRGGGAFAALGSSSASVMAKKMAESVDVAMGASLESIRTMTRGFVADIIRKHEPNIGDDELEALVDHYLPSSDSGNRGEGGSGTSAPGEEGPEKLPLPAEMLLGMARDFVSFSEGSMAPSRQKELWDEMPRWQDEYWKAFPSSIKAIVKAYLEGRIDPATFTSALLTILGL